MSNLITVCLVVVGLVNLAPVVGVLSASKMENAYSVSLPSNDLQILMRHRALLFGVLGGFILYAAFVPALQAAAMVMAGVSMLGFVALAVRVGGYNGAILKVIIGDLAGLGFLVAAVLLTVFSGGQ